MIKILLDSVGVNIVSENFEFFEKNKSKCQFYISPTVLEEFTNMNSIDYGRGRWRPRRDGREYYQLFV